MSIADDEEAQDPWTLPSSRKRREGPIEGPLPKTVQVVRSNLVRVYDYVNNNILIQARISANTDTRRHSDARDPVPVARYQRRHHSCKDRQWSSII